jgi:pSer/pThr/pTyr-binding forkhead associated (FHA) protein
MTEWAVRLNDKIVKRFSMPEGTRLVIGRGSDADVILDNTTISRHHLVLENKNGICVVNDLGSHNGTFLGDQKVENETIVTPGDTVTFGKFTLTLNDGPSEEASLSTVTPMDLEEETVFVGKTPAKPETAGPDTGKNNLQVVSGSASPSSLVLDGKSSVKIGRDPSCNMVISGLFVARTQCCVLNKDGKFFIAPQRSLTATYLNGGKISTEHQLRKDDLIAIGSTKIRFR